MIKCDYTVEHSIIIMELKHHFANIHLAMDAMPGFIKLDAITCYVGFEYHFDYKANRFMSLSMSKLTLILQNTLIQVLAQDIMQTAISIVNTHS